MLGRRFSPGDKLGSTVANTVEEGWKQSIHGGIKRLDRWSVFRKMQTVVKDYNVAAVEDEVHLNVGIVSPEVSIFKTWVR
jgi:hypothetical protein